MKTMDSLLNSIEYWWVPEAAMFKTGSDCLDNFPNLGPACLVADHTKYDQAIKALYEIMKIGTTQHGNTPEAMVAYEVLGKIETGLEPEKKDEK